MLRIERALCCLLGSALSGLLPAVARAQTVTIDTATRHQSIDGFGTCLGSAEAQQTWWQQLYFDDLGASIVRMDITPSFVSLYSNDSYCSPWFGQGAPLSLDNNGNGPDGTRTRQYTGAADYSDSFGGCSAPIAVMGPDIDSNVQLFDFSAKAIPGLVAQLGKARAAQLGDFKLYASMWSPAPWVKISSGHTYSGSAWPGPTAVPWPFIWGGNFAGGELDVSGTPLSQFDDGSGPTSALTQFARGLAAFLRGFQNTYGVSFYAISIQNELNFEEFYNSATYPLASEYVAALAAARTELDSHDDLKGIKIIGPEDLMGGDPYSLWQYGSGATRTEKNLQYLAAVAAGPTALSGFAIHGYGSDGVSSAGADSQQWSYWAEGWQASPAAGIPANVAGFTSFGGPSWMTETSGEKAEWLASSSSGGFPDQGGFSVAVKIQQALTTGQESAWLYWQLTDGNPSDDQHLQTLTDSTQLAQAPKYVAAKHFFRYIRPGAVRVNTSVTGSSTLLASAYVLDAAGALTVVLINEDAAATSVSLALPSSAPTSFQAFASSDGSLWQSSTVTASAGAASLTLPGYGVTTLYGTTVGDLPDAGNADAGPVVDAGETADAGLVDAGPGTDAGETLDAGQSVTDAGLPPPVPARATGSGCGCQSGGEVSSLPWILGILLVWVGVRSTRGRGAAPRTPRV